MIFQNAGDATVDRSSVDRSLGDRNPAPIRTEVRSAVNRLVRSRTGSMLSELRVDVAEEPARGLHVRLSGRCGSYYGKQLAGAAAMAAAPGGRVFNEIAVH